MHLDRSTDVTAVVEETIGLLESLRAA